MTRPRAVLRGAWPASAVDVVPVESSRVVEDELEQAVAAVWADQRRVAHQRGLCLEDAPAYRLEHVAGRNGRLELGLALEPYRVHSAMKVLHRDPRVRRHHHDRILVADALVQCADGQVLLLRTPKPTGVELQLVGGTASPAQRAITCADDLVEFTRERVLRALDGTRGLVEVREVRGLVEHEVGCVNVVIEVRLAVPAAEVLARDGAELVVVPEKSLRQFLRDAPGYLPAVADLV